MSGWGHKHGFGEPCPIRGCWAGPNGSMRVQLLAPDGTVLFVGAVNPKDEAQHITWTQMMNAPTRLVVNATDLYSSGVGVDDE